MTHSSYSSPTCSRPTEADPLAVLDARVAAWSKRSRKAARSDRFASRVLGVEVGYPVGVAPSQNTRSPQHVAFLADCGFNLLTYKTVRSREWKAHPEPRWIHLEDLAEPVAVGTNLETLTGHGSPETVANDGYSFSTANSYGVPSPRPDSWQNELAEAKAALDQGQLLVASVQGSPQIFRTPETLAADFVDVALKAEEAGASVVELNLSCPNTIDNFGAVPLRPICEDPRITGRIVEAVRNALGAHTRLVAKLSYLKSQEIDELVGFILPYIAGLTGINTLQARVYRPDGEPVFRGTVTHPDRPREQAGISGVALRLLARDFVRSAARARARHAGDFDIIGIGGVMVPDDLRVLFDLGASAVQTATIAARNPDFAVEVLREQEERGDRRRLVEFKTLA